MLQIAKAISSSNKVKPFALGKALSFVKSLALDKLGIGINFFFVPILAVMPFEGKTSTLDFA